MQVQHNTIARLKVRTTTFAGTPVVPSADSGCGLLHGTDTGWLAQQQGQRYKGDQHEDAGHRKGAADTGVADQQRGHERHAACPNACPADAIPIAMPAPT